MLAGVIVALGVAVGVSLAVGWREFRRVRQLSDILPVGRIGEATVRNSTEFSTSTTATTVSLATVILAYFELSPYLGPWLFWTALTTGAGLFVVRLAARPILERMERYGARVPSLHEFLGTEFDSTNLRLVAGVCTSLGFLGAMAVELTVGSRFIAQFFPMIPTSLIVLTLAGIGVTYTALGGFRAVIVTDRIQMGGIWIMVATLAIVYGMFFRSQPEDTENAIRLISDFSRRDGLSAFMLGIFVINVPTFLADMSLWQRIGATRESENTSHGLVRSAFGATAVWALLCVLAVIGPSLGVNGEANALVGVLVSLKNWMPGSLVPIVVALIVTGLVSAMFSTASTQLIAFVHASYEDVIRRVHPSISSTSPFGVRVVLLVAAGIAVVLVESLSRAGLSIADLVFAVYGSQLGLVPAVCLALLFGRERLHGLGGWALSAVALAFPVGWVLAIAGRMVGNANMTFLAPVGSLLVSAIVLGLGILVRGLSGRSRVREN